MSTAPDVMGLPLRKAEEVLKKAGIPYRILRTAPPPGRGGQHSDEVRVIRQSSSEDAVILLVCAI